MKNSKLFLSSIIICFIPALIGGLATSSSVTTWYPSLIKPDFTPPNWLFGPAWTVLYLFQGLSLYLIRQTPVKDMAAKKITLSFFYLQLGLNLLWSVLFFGLKNPLLALLEIGFLDITVLFTLISAYRLNKTASFLLLPYMGWISFATWLNFQIFILNP
jgi:tryptophan-rich sensory protein